MHGINTLQNHIPNIERTPWTIFYVNIKSMKYFIRILRKNSIELKLQKKNVLKKHNDRCIIHDILFMTSSTTIITEINALIMHLQVIFLSELTNDVDNRLSPSAFGENRCYRNRSNIQWSKQHNPDKQKLSVGKKMTTTIYCRANNALFLRSNMQLVQ